MKSAFCKSSSLTCESTRVRARVSKRLSEASIGATSLTSEKGFESVSWMMSVSEAAGQTVALHKRTNAAARESFFTVRLRFCDSVGGEP